jgi:hypothetical protein
MNLLIVVWLHALSASAYYDPHTRPCPDSTTFLEFQIVAGDGQPARWINDTALAVHPIPAVRNPANLVQFVVDTSGIPLARTFHALKVTDATLVEAARQSLARWRFAPAVRDGCVVRQLIQTPIGR